MAVLKVFVHVPITRFELLPGPVFVDTIVKVNQKSFNKKT